MREAPRWVTFARVPWAHKSQSCRPSSDEMEMAEVINGPLGLEALLKVAPDAYYAYFESEAAAPGDRRKALGKLEREVRKKDAEGPPYLWTRVATQLICDGALEDRRHVRGAQSARLEAFS